MLEKTLEELGVSYIAWIEKKHGRIISEKFGDV